MQRQLNELANLEVKNKNGVHFDRYFHVSCVDIPVLDVYDMLVAAKKIGFEPIFVSTLSCKLFGLSDVVAEMKMCGNVLFIDHIEKTVYFEPTIGDGFVFDFQEAYTVFILAASN